MKREYADRKKFLEEYWKIYDEWSELGYRLEIQSLEDRKSRIKWSVLYDRLCKMRDSYEESLEFSDISRNPFTGEVLSYRIDTAGLDGLWWDYNLSVRPFEYGVEGFHSISGALKLGAELEEFPFRCKPGPDLPFVFEEVIEMPDMAAVISQLDVGCHTGYPVAYFSKHDVEHYFGYNFWGADYGTVYDSSYGYGSFSNRFINEDCDFELEKWIRRGKLFWIEPGDSELKLKNTVYDCPYLKLQGERRLKTIKSGNVEYEEDIDYELE